MSRNPDHMPAPRRVIIVGKMQVEDLPSNQIRIWLEDRSVIGFFSEKPTSELISAYQDQEVRVSGMAHFQPNGRIAYIFIDRIAKPSVEDDFFRKIPASVSVDQQIAKHRAEGKLANPLAALKGKWPGDEELEELLSMLTR